jgi:periplasmic copper chaperone A
MFSRHFIFALACLACLIGAGSVSAHAYKIKAIEISHPYAHVTLPGQPVGGAYLKITNSGPPDRLVSVSTPQAKSAELHTMSMQGDVMRMREVTAFELPAGKTIELKPGGNHIMLMGLQTPLKAGSSFPITLKFEHAGDLVVSLTVEPIKP